MLHRGKEIVNYNLLLQQVAYETGMKVPDIASFIDVLMNIVRRNVNQGYLVVIDGVGTFHRRNSAKGDESIINLCSERDSGIGNHLCEKMKDSRKIRKKKIEENDLA